MALCPPLVLADAILTRTEELRRGKSFDLKLPGLLVIDTPGVGDGLPWRGVCAQLPWSLTLPS